MESTELVELVDKGDLEAVRKALSEGLSVETSDSMGNSLLIVAARHGHEALVELLIDSRADPNARGWGGTTALMECVSLGAMKTLLDAGADPTLEDDDCETAWSKCEESMASLKAMQEAKEAGQMEGYEDSTFWPPTSDALGIYDLLKGLEGDEKDSEG